MHARMIALCTLTLAACVPVQPPQHPSDHPMTSPSPPLILDASASPITFEKIAAFPTPGWQVPRQVHFSPDGKLVTYLQSESNSERMALFAFDVVAGTHQVLVRDSDLVDPDKPMSREEELRRERQRKKIRGVTGYAWAKKVPVMLVPLGGDVFIRRADGTIKQLTQTAEPEIDPKLCADGTKVAFSRGRELYAIDIASGKETQLTSDAEQGVTRGQSDFNGQEEFSEPSGLWWSPDCNRVAYLEVDERKVREVAVMGYRGDTDLQMLRYPRTGDTNPSVRLGVADIASGKTAWVELPESADIAADDHYLGRVTWNDTGDAIYFQRLSRNQQHLALVRSDPKSGKSRALLSESDATWTEFSRLVPLPGGDFLWTGWRDGHRHIERRNGDTGDLVATLTSGAWDVFDIAGIDAKQKRVLFVANKDEVLDRQLYAVGFDGGAISRLTEAAGIHHIDGRHAEHGYIDVHSAMDRPPQAVLVAADGKQLGEIAVPRADDFDALGIRTPERVELKTKDGATLYGHLLKPRNLKEGQKHPAVLMVYGGPGVQTNNNDWAPRLLWQHLADRGFVVFQVDNRGSIGRGHAFESPLYRKLGDIELRDQLEAADYLASLPYVDGERLGIYGHSYGGYMAALGMLRAPGRFKLGVSGSPVTDWRFYDTGYTERFMGTPKDNEAGYTGSDLTLDADKLVGKLFIIHALMDENVHFSHTAKLIDALVEADKDFDLLVFPGERHGYRSPKARRYAYRRVVDYFVGNL